VILATWKAIEIELELLQNDKMQDLIFAYSTAVQKEAFCAGYKKWYSVNDGDSRGLKILKVKV